MYLVHKFMKTHRFLILSNNQYEPWIDSLALIQQIFYINSHLAAKVAQYSLCSQDWPWTLSNLSSTTQELVQEV